MFQHGSADDLILHFLAEFHEVSAVSGDTYDQVAIFVGFELSFLQYFIIYVAELLLTVAEDRSRTLERDQAVFTFRRLKDAAQQLEVMHHSDPHRFIAQLAD